MWNPCYVLPKLHGWLIPSILCTVAATVGESVARFFFVGDNSHERGESSPFVISCPQIMVIHTSLITGNTSDDNDILADDLSTWELHKWLCVFI